MAIGVLQFWYFTVRVLRERTLPILDMMEPGVAIIWALTAFSALFVGFMIIMLLISHTFMILTNYRTLDGMKTGKMCPVPFCAMPDPNFVRVVIHRSTCTIGERSRTSKKSSETTGCFGRCP